MGRGVTGARNRGRAAAAFARSEGLPPCRKLAYNPGATETSGARERTEGPNRCLM